MEIIIKELRLPVPCEITIKATEDGEVVLINKLAGADETYLEVDPKQWVEEG
ncbi:hypothetical protein LCGC14_2570960 [marine sediment metagenome]|uniref:Uncharacterized protein n=1 Tax=marine sediment metagenome TaxID=412755 RepID=A0A0F9AH79_9ZZZZ